MKTGLMILGAAMVAAGVVLSPISQQEDEIQVVFEPVEIIEQKEPAQEIHMPYTGARLVPREFSYDEAQMLMRIAQAEAGNQGKEGMEQVMAVVLNRVASDDFPDSIQEVIFQPHQFQPISDGRYYKVDLSPEVHEALAYVEGGYPLDDQIVAFEITSSKSLDRYFTYAYTVGDHNFYTEKGGE